MQLSAARMKTNFTLVPTSTKDKKEMTRMTLSKVSAIVGILQGVSEVNPCAKVTCTTKRIVRCSRSRSQACVNTLASLLQFELDRRENDYQIVRAFESMVRAQRQSCVCRESNDSFRQT